MSRDMVKILYESSDNQFQMIKHYHNHYEIIYIVSGIVTVRISGKRYNINENSLVFINEFESHDISVKSYPYDRYYLLVEPEFLYRTLNDPVLLSIFKQRPIHFRHAITINPELSTGVKTLFKEMLIEYRQKKDLWKSAVGSLLHLLLLNVYRSYYGSFPASAMTEAQEIIMHIQEHIDSHYTDNIRLIDIAARYHMDMYYLSRLFSTYTGYTFKEYVTLQRISKARDLLYNTNCSITRVGMDSGFNNVNHFIRIFKKYEGITPLQYRKRTK